MKLRSGRGQVLMQVLVMSILMMMLATVLMRITMQQAVTAAKVKDVAAAVAQYQPAIISIVNAWAIQGGTTCGPKNSWTYTWSANASVTCNGTSGSCSCTCSGTLPPIPPSSTPYTFSGATASTVSGVCQISLTVTF